MAAREKRKANKREEDKDNSKPDDEKIRKLAYLGFTVEDVSTIIGRGIWYIRDRRSAMERKGLINRKAISSNTKNRVANAEKRLRQLLRIASFNADIDVQIAQDQIDYEKAMAQLGDIQLANIELLSKVIPMSSELITPGNVNFITRQFTRNDMGEEALRFMDECIVTTNYEKESMVRKLTEGKREIEKHMQKQAERKEFVEGLLKAPKAPSTEGIGEEEEGHGGH